MCRFSNYRVISCVEPRVTPNKVGFFQHRNQLMDELDNFFKKYPEAGAGKRAREQARENIQNNVNWLKTHQETIHQWFSRNLLY